MAALTYEERVSALAGWLKGCNNAVFFGGAGVSTESGIPDFRSAAGLYNKRGDMPDFGHFPPETLLSHDFFFKHTDIFYAYHRTRICHPEARPNAAHRALARLEDMGILSCVITQNIDGLHQAAGSRAVHELHGSIRRNVCVTCGELFTLEHIMGVEGVPRCGCGGLIKPDVVLYGEALPEKVIHSAIKAVREADVLIIGGTSLTVYPAASLPDYFRGAHMALINRDETPRDGQMSAVFRESIGAVMGDTVKILTCATGTL